MNEVVSDVRAARAYREFLGAVGIKCDDPDTVDTPLRVAKMYRELFATVGKELKIVREVKDHSCEIKLMQFDRGQYDQLIIEQDIPFSSMCSHHHVPFIGKGHIGYLPGEGLVGLSKLARVLEFFSRRPQSQEQLAEQVANFIHANVKPRFVMVVLQAEHMCMSIRGAKKPGVLTTTSKLLVNGLSARAIGELKEEMLGIISWRR